MTPLPLTLNVFFFNDTATTEIYTLSLHDALPIFGGTSTSNVNDHQPANPFSVVVLTDVDPGQTYSISVTIGTAPNCTPATLSARIPSTSTSEYPLSGVTISAAHASLLPLVVTPTA